MHYTILPVGSKAVCLDQVITFCREMYECRNFLPKWEIKRLYSTGQDLVLSDYEKHICFSELFVFGDNN